MSGATPSSVPFPVAPIQGQEAKVSTRRLPDSQDSELTLHCAGRTEVQAFSSTPEIGAAYQKCLDRMAAALTPDADEAGE